jgi:hypothetical protein
MKNLLLFGTAVITLLFISCTENRQIGDWDDNIHLSQKTATFNAVGDSITITTGGSGWWITDITIDKLIYTVMPEIDIQSESYSVTKNGITAQRRNKNTLFIKADANTLITNRIINIGLEDEDYFDGITITQKGN